MRIRKGAEAVHTGHAALEQRQVAVVYGAAIAGDVGRVHDKKRPGGEIHEKERTKAHASDNACAMCSDNGIPESETVPMSLTLAV